MRWLGDAHLQDRLVAACSGYLSRTAGLVVTVAVAIACGEADRQVVAPGSAAGTPVAGSAAATAASAAAAAPHARELAALHDAEDQRRRNIDFATLPPSDAALGPDPYRIVHTRAGTHVGLLRGDGAVVIVGADGRELARAPAPRSASGIAVSPADVLLVVGEDERTVAQFAVAPGGLERVATLPVDALGMRDIAWSPDGKTAYVVEDHDGRLLALTMARGDGPALRVAGVRELGRCHGPIRVAAIAGYVATDCLLDHAIELRRDGAGDAPVTRIVHDGPIWSLALAPEPGGGLLVAAGGIEDHALVREDGGFGYIDSFVFLYRVARGAGDRFTATRLAAVNVSALGTVTPKWLAIRRADDGGVDVTTAGYGSPGVLALHWQAGTYAADPQVHHADLPPGTAAAEVDGDGAIIAANPLLDAWVVTGAGAGASTTRIVAVPSPRPARAMESRVGEMLFFTTMMAPWNSSEGALSRFTCEACHHEGYVDGRVHFTGRSNGADKVHATTRPLLGLFNNRPHFSRALDQTMSGMVHAEFRVANRHNGRDPWFAVSRADMPWLAELGAPAEMPAELLRGALIAFLADFTPRANPAVVVRTSFGDVERAGARVFRDRCAECHAARLVADDPTSLVAFDRWEALVMSARRGHRVERRRAVPDRRRAVRPSRRFARAVAAPAVQEVAVLHQRQRAVARRGARPLRVRCRGRVPRQRARRPGARPTPRRRQDRPAGIPLAALARIIHISVERDRAVVCPKRDGRSRR